MDQKVIAKQMMQFKVISNKEYLDIFGSFSPKGAYYVSPGHRPGLAYNHIF